MTRNSDNKNGQLMAHKAYETGKYVIWQKKTFFQISPDNVGNF